MESIGAAIINHVDPDKKFSGYTDVSERKTSNFNARKYLLHFSSSRRFSLRILLIATGIMLLTEHQDSAMLYFKLDLIHFIILYYINILILSSLRDGRLQTSPLLQPSFYLMSLLCSSGLK